MFNKTLCFTHYQMMRRDGKLHRSREEPNEITKHDNYAEILLYDNKSNVIAKTKIDLEDIKKVKGYKWGLLNGYVKNYKKLGRLHRYLLGFKPKSYKERDITVDHINRDKLDNRKENLRICTVAENNYNKGLRKDNKSGSIGVYWHKKLNKWVAELHYKKEKVFYGSFNEKEKAIKARKKAEEKYFGEFAPIRKGD